MKATITIASALMLACSCIGENYDNCPDYGKYLVLFKDSSCCHDMSSGYMNLYYSEQDGKCTPSGVIFQYNGHDTIYHPGENFKLYPGEYHMTTIVCSSAINYEQKKPFENGYRYLYHRGVHNIQKKRENIIVLEHKLANSMLVVKCVNESDFDHCITNIKITPPVEQDAILGIQDGRCSCEQDVGLFLEPMYHDNDSDSWYYYCNPLVPGKDIVLEITLADTTEYSSKSLYTRVFMESGLEQGKIHTLHIGVSSNEIGVVLSGITNWEDQYHNPIISL